MAYNKIETYRNEFLQCSCEVYHYLVKIYIAVFILCLGVGDVIPVKGRGSNPAQEHEGPQPYFDVDVQRNITAIATQTAFLHCRVKDLGVKAVSIVKYFLKLSINVNLIIQ